MAVETNRKFSSRTTRSMWPARVALLVSLLGTVGASSVLGGCAVSETDVKRWEGTERGPVKLVAVLTHDKYKPELRIEAALALVRMKPRGGKKVGFTMLLDKYKDEEGVQREGALKQLDEESRKMIVNGRAEMSFDLSDEAKAQLELRYELAATVARRYVAAGFVVVYQDIHVGPGLRSVVDRFTGVPLSVFVLAPTAEVIASREAGRPKSGYGSPTELAAFDRVLREETERLGTWLDTSALTVAHTVDVILNALENEAT